MADKKVSTQSKENPSSENVARAEGNNTPPVIEYTVRELAAAAKTVFPGISPDCVTAALRMAGITKTTKEKAREIVTKFVSEPVSDPRKGGD